MLVATDEFVDAFRAQAQELNLPAASAVYVPHPIQDRTDEEMTALADAAYEAVIAAVTAR